MKKLLIAASIVGVAGAGLIMYIQRSLLNPPKGQRSLNNAIGSDHMLSGSPGAMERPPHHAMG